jgi:hypothetical protein
MKTRKWVAACLSLPPILYLVLDTMEFFHARADTAHLYPFGSEHAGWFYKSLAHYRLLLSVDAALSTIALFGVVGMWQGLKYSWVFYLPFLFWIPFSILTASE